MLPYEFLNEWLAIHMLAQAISRFNGKLTTARNYCLIGCVEINQLCDFPPIRELLCRVGAVQALLDALKTFPVSIGVQYAGCQALAKLSVDCNELRLHLGVSGAGTVLVEALARFSGEDANLQKSLGSQALPHCEGVRNFCLAAIFQLLQVEENMVPLLRANAWETVVNAMAAFPEDNDLTLSGCRLLIVMAEGLIKSGTANTKAMDVIMRQSPACQVVFRASTRALRHVENAAHQAVALSPLVQDFLLQGAWLTSSALAALASLSFENARQLVDLGACEHLRSLMRLCTNDVVVEWTVRALAEIALSLRGGFSPGAKADSQEHAWHTGMKDSSTNCQAVVAAVSIAPQNQNVQFAGCYAVATLATDCRKHQLQFHASHAVEMILQALRLFPDADHVQEWGHRALAVLASDCPENQSAILQNHGHVLVTSTLSRFLHLARVYFSACYVIVNLAQTNLEARKALGTAGACQQVVRGFAGPCGSDLDVLEWSCRALGDLANGCRENQERIRLEGGCTKVLETLSLLKETSPVHVSGCYALTHLIAGNRDAQVQVGASHGCEKLVNVILKSLPDSQARLWAFRALLTLTDTSLSVDRIVEMGTVPEMMEVINTWVGKMEAKAESNGGRDREEEGREKAQSRGKEGSNGGDRLGNAQEEGGDAARRRNRISKSGT